MFSEKIIFDPHREIRRRRVALFCWVQVVVAAFLLFVSIVADFRAPTLGLWWRTDGTVTDVAAGGPAHRAGLHVGDRLLRINGEAPSVRQPLLNAAAGRELDVELVSDRGIEILRLTPEMRVTEHWRVLASDPQHALSSVGGILRTVVNLWVLLVAGLVLGLRPDHPAARVASVALAAWAGGNLLTAIPGASSLLTGTPHAVQLLIYLLDAAYSSFVFAAFLHFAMLFPNPLPAVRRTRELQLIPYVVALPLFAVAANNVFALLRPTAGATMMNPAPLFGIYAPLLLVAELAVLGWQYHITDTRADRRRILLVFASMVPAFVAWVASIILDAMAGAATARGLAAVLQWTGAAAGSAIFAYALARQRLFGIRPLIRRSIEYILARGTLLASIAVPAIALCLFVYSRRRESLVEIFSRDLAVIAALALPVAVLLRFRRQILEAIERRFFREEFESRQSLMRLVSMVQRGNDVAVLARVALTEIEKALRPANASFWRRDDRSNEYRCAFSVGESRPQPVLAASTLIAKALSDRREPIEFDFRRRTISRRFAEEDRRWIEAARPALLVPLSIQTDLLGFILLGERAGDEPYGAEDVNLLKTVAAQLAITEDYARLEQLARRDPLTEALNRHAFYSLVHGREMTEARPRPGCVAVVDVNDLKKINDTSGHSAGDRAIRRVATAIRSLVRADDLVFRWGGDEFLVVVFGLPYEEVVQRFESLNSVLMKQFSGPINSLQVSVAVGIAPFDHPELIQTAIEDADRAMYARKQQRKQKVEQSPPV